MVVPTETEDSINNSGDIYHLHLYHTNFVDNEDLDYDTEVGYHVIGAPDSIEVPVHLLPTVNEDSPSCYKEPSINYVAQIQSSLEAEILMEKLIEPIDQVLTVNSDSLQIPSFGTHVTTIEVFVNKVKVLAVIDTGAPVNVISTNLVKKIKLAPDLPYTEKYGTAGPISTNAVGAYSLLPMRFGKFVVSAPAIVLPNKSYNILSHTHFLMVYSTV